MYDLSKYNLIETQELPEHKLVKNVGVTVDKGLTFNQKRLCGSQNRSPIH